MEFINNLDKQISSLIIISLPHNQFFDYIFSFFSLRGNSFFIWAAIIIFVLIFEERKYPGISKRDIFFVTIFVISFFIASLASQVLLKNMVKRPRPCAKVAELAKEFSVDFNCLTDYSFPSSHATTAFAAATVITAFDKRRRWFYFLVAVLIGLSRIYLGYHYFFDVVAGSLLGWLISKIILSYQPRKT